MVFVHDGSFLGIDWNAVNAIATIVAVVAAVVGSYRAWTGIQAQIAAAQSQHADVLSAARRPHLVLRKLQLDPLNPGFLPQRHAANIGVGPAMSPVLDVWIHPSPAPGLRAAGLVAELTDEAPRVRGARTADARGLPGSIGAGDSTNFDVNPLTPLNLTVPVDHQMLVMWHMTYHDLDGVPYGSSGTIPLTDRNGALVHHESLASQDGQSSTM